MSLITLNLPERRNALSPGVMGGLIQAMRNAEEDDAVRCIVITGAGSSFCAGGDVTGFVAKIESGAYPPWIPAGKEPHYAPVLRSMSKPIIAAVNLK
ncbi:enoyl-CoA hydratase/isomerase family protein [Chloroflexota bacterium]